MKMIQTNINEMEAKHTNLNENYEYYRKSVIPYQYSKETKVSVYEIPPLKASYPYHYHEKSEETFYIVSGEGELRTPEGTRKVSAGDFLFFPADKEGAHKLTNSSATESLVYIDFDVAHDLDVCIYPDSNKVGVFGKDIHKFYKIDDDKDYYDGE